MVDLYKKRYAERKYSIHKLESSLPSMRMPSRNQRNITKFQTNACAMFVTGTLC